MGCFIIASPSCAGSISVSYTHLDNVSPEAPYYYLTELAARCTAKRMVPDYISEKIMKQLKVDQNGDGQCYTCMGCRSFLTPYVDENGKPKYYGRFNQGVVTVNLCLLYTSRCV